MTTIKHALGQFESLIALANEQAVKEGRAYYCQGCVHDAKCEEIPAHFDCNRTPATRPEGEGQR